MDIIERAGDRLNLAVVLGNVGESALGVGAYRRSTEVLQRSLTLANELSDSRQAGWSLAHLAFASLLEGDSKRGRQLFAESLPKSFEAHDTAALGVCLHGIAALSAEAGDAERSARLWGAAGHLRESLGAQPPPYEQALEEQYLAGARLALGDAFPRLEAEGRALGLEDAVALATVEVDAAPGSRSLI